MKNNNEVPSVTFQRDHLWDYFQLHANQRITLFRFYIIFLGFFVTGIIFLVIRYPYETYIHEGLGLALSLLLVAITFIFSSLDKRNRQLIGYSEKLLVNVEDNDVYKSSAVFTKELDDKKNGYSVCSHSNCFFILYLSYYGIALLLFIYSLIHICCSLH